MLFRLTDCECELLRFDDARKGWIMTNNFLASLCQCFVYEKEEDYIELVEFEPKEETFISVSSLSYLVPMKDQCSYYLCKELGGERSYRLVHSTSIVKTIQ